MRVSPDGMSVAVRTQFDDVMAGADYAPGVVRAWLYASHQGMTGFLSDAQVADWPPVTGVGELYPGAIYPGDNVFPV
jgi:hypothetical protein